MNKYKVLYLNPEDDKTWMIFESNQIYYSQIGLLRLCHLYGSEIRVLSDG